MNKNKSLTIILKLNKKYFKNDNIKNNKIGQIYLYINSTYKITFLLYMSQEGILSQNECLIYEMYQNECLIYEMY